MLRRDFIMVQIEELGKVIARIIGQRHAGDTAGIPEQIQVVYDSLKLDSTFLMNASPEEIRKRLDYEDSCGILRMEIAVKALMEESFLYPEDQNRILTRAQELLEFIQRNDNTFSLERVSLLNEIQQLKKENQ